MLDTDLIQYISEKERLIRLHFPLIKETHFELSYVPSEFSKPIPDNRNDFTLDTLKGFYIETENGMQASFLDGNGMVELEECYHVTNSMPNSRLIAISSQAILLTENKGFCKKDYGDLDESDAVYLGFDLFAILNDPLLIEELLDY